MHLLKQQLYCIHFKLTWERYHRHNFFRPVGIPVVIEKSFPSGIEDVRQSADRFTARPDRRHMHLPAIRRESRGVHGRSGAGEQKKHPCKGRDECPRGLLFWGRKSGIQNGGLAIMEVSHLVLLSFRERSGSPQYFHPY